jgi:hypothetical protein
MPGMRGIRRLTTMTGSAPTMHPEAERHGQRDNGDGSRGDDAQSREHRDQQEAERDGTSRADPTGEPWPERREHAHAHDGDGREQPGFGVGDGQVVLDLRQQRTDGEELRPYREHAEEEGREQADREPVLRFGT